MSATSVDQVPAARTPLSLIPASGARRAAARRPPAPSLPAAMGSGGRSAPAMAAPARPRRPLFITAGPRQLRSASPLRGPARPGGSASARAASEPSAGPVGARFLSPFPERFPRLSLFFSDFWLSLSLFLPFSPHSRFLLSGLLLRDLRFFQLFFDSSQGFEVFSAFARPLLLFLSWRALFCLGPHFLLGPLPLLQSFLLAASFPPFIFSVFSVLCLLSPCMLSGFLLCTYF